MLIVFGTLVLLVRIVVYGGIFVFAIWAFRRYRLKSLFWLSLYLLFLVPLCWVHPVMTQLNSAMITKGAPFGWTVGLFFATWGMSGQLLRVLALGIIGLLLASDLLFLLREFNHKIEGRVFGKILSVRELSGHLGLAMVILEAIQPIATLGMYLYYFLIPS